jgi:hypothetical protein
MTIRRLWRLAGFDSFGFLALASLRLGISFAGLLMPHELHHCGELLAATLQAELWEVEAVLDKGVLKHLFPVDRGVFAKNASLPASENIVLVVKGNHLVSHELVNQW